MMHLIYVLLHPSILGSLNIQILMEHNFEGFYNLHTAIYFLPYSIY